VTRRAAAWLGRVLLGVGLIACQDARPDAGSADSVKVTERAVRGILRVGALTDRALDEASGAVVGTRRPNVYWSQNDRGNRAELFAYDSTGRALGTVPVSGVSNVDWEALSLGPCATGSCLYIADVGDNSASRDEVQIYRIPEPPPGDEGTPSAAVLRIAHRGGPRDIEAMWVAPDTSLWLLTKRPDPDSTGRLQQVRLARVAASAWRSDTLVVAVFLDSLPIVPDLTSSARWVTDAALSALDAEGKAKLAVLTYGYVYVFDASAKMGRPGALVARCALKGVPENFSEGITWLPDGRLLFVNEGRGAGLYVGFCP